LNSNPSDAAALTDLEVFCASHFRKRRPKQVMSNVLLSAQDSSASRAVQEGQALPFETHSLRNQLGTSFGHVADLIMLPDAAIQVLFGTSFGRQKLDSLDTLYMQAIMLEPSSSARCLRLVSAVHVLPPLLSFSLSAQRPWDRRLMVIATCSPRAVRPLSV